MKILRSYFAIVAYMALVILILYSRIHLESQIIEGGNNDVLSHRPPNSQRRGLLIIGQGRSGTSFISKMFSKGLQISEVYEPFRYHSLSDGEKLQVIKAFITCQFTGNTLWHSRYFPPFWFLRHEDYVIKPFEHIACLQFPIAQREYCFNTNELMKTFISKCYENDTTVVKELSDRLPGMSMASLGPLLNDPTVKADIRLLHVVRDPRASINSRIKLRWFPDYEDPSFKQKVQVYCDLIFKNIEFGRALSGSLQDKYKVIFYRDIATRPLEIAQEIFNFAQVKISNETLQWVIDMTKPIDSEAIRTALRDPFSVLRNSVVTIDKWKDESPTERIRVIEQACQPLLEVMENLSLKNKM
ncbi:carbohydrate sulfotransferase 3-like [Montipora capricornis]|uniref:carbohydrate sulfotransferase 3-like n=1 Tax=Montipora capricornis TaxID=246305 RepID=UPI0035F11C2E